MIRRLESAGHACVIDQFVVTEARRNLVARGPEALERFEDMIEAMEIGPARAVHPDPEAVVWLPEKDRPVLLAAIRLRCHALVTGDKTHFGAGYGKTIGGVTLHSPASLALSLWPS